MIEGEPVTLGIALDHLARKALVLFAQDREVLFGQSGGGVR